MSDSHPSRGGAAASVELQTVDLSAMPRVLRRITAMAAEHPWRMTLAILAALASTVASLALPHLFGGAVDRAHEMLSAGPARADAARQALLVTAGLVIVASTVRGLLQMYSGYLGEWIGQSVAYKLRLRFFQQLQRLSFGFHDRIHSGDLITRGMLDMEGLRGFIEQGLLRAVSLVLLVVLSAYMMWRTDPFLALLAMSFVPFAAWRLARMGYLLRVTWLQFQRLMSILTLTMEENLQGIRVVRAFAAKPFEMMKFDQAALDALALARRRLTVRFSAVASLNISFYASMGLLLWFGGRKVMGGELSVGQLTAFLTYMTLLQAPVRMIAMIFMAAARATSSGGRVFEVLDIEPEIQDAPGAKPLDVSQGVLRFEHVDFRYDGGGPLILSDVSFEVGPGKTLGIVGPPGSGKSTIANLVPRFYDVSAGKVSVDGQDVREVTLASLRDHVGLVQQEAFLFDASVINNVAYADPWAEEERIKSAASTAQIHDYITTMPAGYETRIGERGVSLSGGQRQRMSIARGVVPGPGIMIFDDSTAAIDAVTEKRVREALSSATRQKATIIIAHRLSSLMHADEIIVLDDGRIIERGTHAELLALGGEYAALYELQSKSDAGALPEDPRKARKAKEAVKA